MLETLQNSILELIVALVAFVITPFLISLIMKLGKWVVAKIDNEHLAAIAGRIDKLVVKYVTITNQTYVDSLKETGNFDEAAQKIAFQKTYDAIMANLPLDLAEFITNTYGDLEAYVRDYIEFWTRNLKK